MEKQATVFLFLRILGCQTSCIRSFLLLLLLFSFVHGTFGQIFPRRRLPWLSLSLSLWFRMFVRVTTLPYSGWKRSITHGLYFDSRFPGHVLPWWNWGFEKFPRPKKQLLALGGGGFYEPLATRKPNISSELEILAIDVAKILYVYSRIKRRINGRNSHALKRIWNRSKKFCTLNWRRFSNPPVESAWSSSSCTRSIACTRSSPRLFFHAIDPRGSSFRDATRDSPSKFTLVKETRRRGFPIPASSKNGDRRFSSMGIPSIDNSRVLKVIN